MLPMYIFQYQDKDALNVPCDRTTAELFYNIDTFQP